MYGTLYGIGVGPGDPELITLKAAHILKRVDIVYAAASTKNDHSLAEGIVSSHIRGSVPIVRLKFPMTRDRERLKCAWEENAEKIIHTLLKGRDAALITLGDPMTYSTFGYIMRTVHDKAPQVCIKVIPGITSYQAASASVGWTLAEGEESFTVVSGALGAQRLKEVIDHTDNVVILKVYRNYKEILNTLEQMDLSSRSILISHCGLEGERIVTDIKALPDVPPPYLSLLLVKKKDRE